MLRAQTHSESETIAFGAALAAILRDGDLVALHGDLGAGKTRLVRGVAQGLGIDPSLVSSPTFVIMHVYEGSGVTLTHIDAYRLSGDSDLESIGWDPADERPGISVIEWPERIAPLLSDARRLARVTLTPTGEHSRDITLETPPHWADRRGWEELLPFRVRTDGATALPKGWTRCPVTGQPVAPDAPTFPFANARARMADLGRWMTEAYRVPQGVDSDASSDLAPDQIDDPDLPTDPDKDASS